MKMMNKNGLQKQKGIALVMALIMLLLITIIGVASVRMTNVDTQVSGNSMFSFMVFQGAESALGKVASINDYYNIQTAASRSTVPVQIPAAYFTPIETVNGGAQLASSAEMIYEGVVDGSLYGNIPNSNEFKYQVFRTTAESRLQATAARAIHVEGVAVQTASE